MSRTTAYRTWLQLAAVVLAVGALTQCSPDASRAAAAAAAAEHARLSAAAGRALEQQACRANLPHMEAEYATQTGQGAHGVAASVLSHCSQLLQDPRLSDLVRLASQRHDIAVAPDGRRLFADRLQAARRLARDYSPEIASAHAALLAKLEAQAPEQERRAAAANARRVAAEKRKSGVHVGMTMADVRASSWGKPERINRTTTARSVREQWVYGGGGYLYFDDDQLTSIQN